MKSSKRGFLPLAILLSILLASFGSADIVSINSGGSKTTAITPSKNIEGFFLGGSKEEKPEPSPSPGGGGGGGSAGPKQEKNETDNFKLNKKSISVIMESNQTTERCFTITSLKDEAIFGLKIEIQGEISNYTIIDKKEINLMSEMSEVACIEFSSLGIDKINTNGIVNVTKNQTKTLDLKMQVKEPEKIEKEKSDSSDDKNKTKTDEQEEPPIRDIRGIETLILWLPLLLAILIFLIIKKYSQFMKSISGKKTREERIAQVERIKRASKRSDKNVIESIVNKAAIFLTRKTVGEREEETVHFS